MIIPRWKQKLSLLLKTVRSEIGITGQRQYTINHGQIFDIVEEVIKDAPSQPNSGGESVADGWKLVPIEPSREMLNAAIDVDGYKLGDISPLGFRCSPQQLFERCYKSMIAAAPSAPPKDHAEGGE